YYSGTPIQAEERVLMEADIARKCLKRSDVQNHLSILELVQAYVEILNTYFDNVCELDIMFNIEKVHVILEEMVSNGRIVETNKHNVLAPVLEMNKSSR
ncbi:31383_t:CDS:2, partial [Racocetra persica]